MIIAETQHLILRIGWHYSNCPQQNIYKTYNKGLYKYFLISHFWYDFIYNFRIDKRRSIPKIIILSFGYFSQDTPYNLTRTGFRQRRNKLNFIQLRDRLHLVRNQLVNLLRELLSFLICIFYNFCWYSLYQHLFLNLSKQPLCS